MFAFTNIVMYYAPVGVGAAMAYTVGQMGPGVLLHLGRLLLTLYAALLAFVLVGMLPAALIARVPIRRFLRAVAEPATIAFATSTSEAALPRGSRVQSHRQAGIATLPGGRRLAMAVFLVGSTATSVARARLMADAGRLLASAN